MICKSLFFTIGLLLLSSQIIGQDESTKIEGNVSFIEGLAIVQIDLDFDPLAPSRSMHLYFPNVEYESLTYKFDQSKESVIFYPDPHTNEGKNKDEALSTLIMIPKNAQSISLNFSQNTIEDLEYKIEIFHQEDIRLKAGTLDDIMNRECLCSSPSYQNREDWGCPWGEDSTIFIPTYSEISHIVVHHQAGAATAPYANTVRSIWNFHVNSNGWSDIGYHWLIDPDGVVYKGRAWLDGDQNIQGAHICACNSNKMGVCLLGDLTNNGPTEAQYESLVNLIAAKGCELDIPPIEIEEVVSRISGDCVLELTKNVIGHRQGCPSGYTACPGDAFFPKFDVLLADAQEQYEACLGGINNVGDALESDITITPNPNQGQFIIKTFVDLGSITIFNTKGQIVFKRSNSNLRQTLIDIHNPGYYLAKIMDNNGRFSYRKIIVAR